MLAWISLHGTNFLCLWDAFYDHRTDILVDAGGYTSSVLGVPVPKKNNGIVDNKGVEIALSWNDRISDFAYHIGGTVYICS